MTTPPHPLPLPLPQRKNGGKPRKSGKPENSENPETWKRKAFVRELTGPLNSLNETYWAPCFFAFVSVKNLFTASQPKKITKLVEKMGKEGKEKSLHKKYRDSQEFISFLKLEVDHYKKAYEREKLKREALLMKNGNRRVFDSSAPDPEIPTMMSERSQVPTPQIQVWVLFFRKFISFLSWLMAGPVWLTYCATLLKYWLIEKATETEELKERE